MDDMDLEGLLASLGTEMSWEMACYVESMLQTKVGAPHGCPRDEYY